MNVFADVFQSIRQRILSISIFKRIAIGNTLIIIIGAVVGTLLTRHLTNRAADVWLIILFILLGTLLSVSINFLIVRSTIRPLQELRQYVDTVQPPIGSYDPHTEIFLPNFKSFDPDIDQLVGALDSMITRLDDSNQQLRALSERAINAQEEERIRIARSLHDDTGQALSMLLINLERIENNLPKEQPEIKMRLISARQLASSILDELRKIIYNLRPTILDDLGLIPAIRWYARTNLNQAGIQVEINLPEEQIVLSPHLKTTMFRITQEAVNNIVRHSKARNASITLSKNGEAVLFSAQDDGDGFDISHTPIEAIKMHQWGLVGIQERVELVGGNFRITSAPNKGTQIEVTIPLPSSGEFQDA
jgi:two-component system sensor histidine kinase UhpB